MSIIGLVGVTHVSMIAAWVFEPSISPQADTQGTGVRRGAPIVRRLLTLGAQKVVMASEKSSNTTPTKKTTYRELHAQQFAF